MAPKIPSTPTVHSTPAIPSAPPPPPAAPNAGNTTSNAEQRTSEAPKLSPSPQSTPEGQQGSTPSNGGTTTKQDGTSSSAPAVPPPPNNTAPHVAVKNPGTDEIIPGGTPTNTIGGEPVLPEQGPQSWRDGKSNTRVEDINGTGYAMGFAGKPLNRTVLPRDTTDGEWETFSASWRRGADQREADKMSVEDRLARLERAAGFTVPGFRPRRTAGPKLRAVS